MGELSTEFDWQAVVEELEKKYITFNLKPEYQKYSNTLLLEKVDEYFEWHFSNNNKYSSSEVFSLIEITNEIQSYNYGKLWDKFRIEVTHSSKYEEMKKEIKNKEDEEQFIDDLCAWHYESEAYEYYVSDFDEIGVYGNMEKYIAEVLTDYGIMFMLDDSVTTCEYFPEDCEVYVNNCQNSLFDNFSPQKTHEKMEFDESIGFIFIPKTNRDTLMMIGGAVHE